MPLFSYFLKTFPKWCLIVRHLRKFILLAFISFGCVHTLYAQYSADFVCDVTEGCVPLECHFTDESTPGCYYGCDIVEWNWYANDQLFSTEQNPAFTFNDPGTFTIKLQIRDVGGYTTFVIKDNFINVDSCSIGETISCSENKCALLDDPVATGTGEYFFTKKDLVSLGPLPFLFKRFYGTLVNNDGYVNSLLGTNFVHNYEQKLVIEADRIVAVMFAGKLIEFEKDNDAWVLKSKNPTIHQLVYQDNEYTLYDPIREVMFVFDSAGVLQKIMDRDGNTHTLNYVGDVLESVSDGLGREYQFDYLGGKLSSVTDHAGRTIHYSYSGNRLLSVTDSMGFITEYTYTDKGELIDLIVKTELPESNFIATQSYDSEGKVSSQTDGEGGESTLTYMTPESQDTTVEDPQGDTRVHSYTSHKYLSKFVDVTGNEAQFSYDAFGRRIEAVDKKGNTYQIEYHEQTGKLKSFTDPEGHKTEYFYTQTTQNGLNFYDVTSITYPDGKSFTFVYDDHGNVLTKTNKRGDTWTYTYNDMGQMLSMENPKGGTSGFQYDERGNKIQKTDHFGNMTTYAYNLFDRLISCTYADGNTCLMSYDDNGNLMSYTDELGNVFSFTYNMNNLMTSATDGKGNTAVFSYDERDKLVQTVNRDGNATLLTYDEEGKPISIQNALGESLHFSYDDNDRPNGVSSSMGKVGTRSFDDEGVLESITNPAGNSWQIVSDQMGRPVQIITPLGNMSSAKYNDQFRLESFTNPLFRTTSNEFDENGNLKMVSNANDESVQYTYDSLGRITHLSDAINGEWQAEFNPIGQKTTFTDPGGNTTNYEYDNRNRVSRVLLPGSATVDFEYDERGYLITKSYSDGEEYHYEYDELGRLTSSEDVTLEYNNQGMVTNNNGITVTRDAAGKITTMMFGAGKIIRYYYNSDGLVYKIDDWRGTAVNFSYDNNGRITALDRKNGVSTYIEYDPDGQLIGLSENKSGVLSDIAIKRDAVGNIISCQKSLPEMPSFEDSNQSFTYNTSSEIQDYQYDSLGNRTTDNQASYDWHVSGNLSGYHYDSKDVTFEYNGTGLRTKRTEDEVETTYVWNYATSFPVVSLIKKDGNDYMFFVYLPSGHLIYSILASNSSHRYYHFDEVGNTLFLTNDDGNITDTYTMDPYGMLVSKSGETENPFIFSGAMGIMQEGNQGLYYIKSRYYDSVTGRFISRDVLWPRIRNPITVNPYQYALNNPANNIDRYGMPDFVQFNAWYSGSAKCELKREPVVETCKDLDGDGYFNGCIAYNGETYEKFVYDPVQNANPFEWENCGKTCEDTDKDGLYIGCDELFNINPGHPFILSDDVPFPNCAPDDMAACNAPLDCEEFGFLNNCCNDNYVDLPTCDDTIPFFYGPDGDDFGDLNCTGGNDIPSSRPVPIHISGFLMWDTCNTCVDNDNLDGIYGTMDQVCRLNFYGPDYNDVDLFEFNIGDSHLNCIPFTTNAKCKMQSDSLDSCLDNEWLSCDRY